MNSAIWSPGIVNATVRRLIGDEAEGYALLDAGAEVISCFLPMWRTEGWYDMGQRKARRELEGRSIALRLSLLPRTVRRTPRRTRRLQRQGPEVLNRYRIAGEITVAAEGNIIVNCGVPILIPVGLQRFEVGEFAQAEGRLEGRLASSQVTTAFQGLP